MSHASVGKADVGESVLAQGLIWYVDDVVRGSEFDVGGRGSAMADGRRRALRRTAIGGGVEANTGGISGVDSDEDAAVNFVQVEVVDHNVIILTRCSRHMTLPATCFMTQWHL